MELQFAKQGCSCMKRVISQVKELEQTQELRLPDAMPDIGRVLGCWGQILIRGKHWRTDEVGASGGVMVWVLYAPEDGSAMQTVESWIPFQMKWDLPETQRDGTILLQPMLTNMDARSISARKMMLRCNVSVMAQAMEPGETVYYVPQSVPEDVQLNVRNYPVVLPFEAGEKSFELEENISAPDINKIIRYCAQPYVTEQKVMASRLVFRGGVQMNILYMDESGNIKSGKYQLPFAQYTDLDRDYSSAATSRILPVLTGCEIQMGENGVLTVKATVTAQYVINDRTMISLADDAYSTTRELKPQMGELTLPMELDSTQMQEDHRADIQDDVREVLDVTALWSHPGISRDGELATIEMPVHYQLLCVDANGSPKTLEAKQIFRWQMQSDEGNQIYAYPGAMGEMHTELTADGVVILNSVSVDTVTVGTAPIPMVTSVELGETKKKDGTGPSLILRRPAGQSLWDIAKEYGTTVADIEKANELSAEPENDKILLIPVS